MVSGRIDILNRFPGRGMSLRAASRSMKSSPLPNMRIQGVISIGQLLRGSLMRRLLGLNPKSLTAITVS
jgi:hypothetical protein